MESVPKANLEEIEAKLADPSATSDDLARMEKVTSILRSAAEARKFDQEGNKATLEAENIHQSAQSEASRFRISVAALLISVTAVFGPLMGQFYQVNKNAELQRQANDARQFSEAAKMATSDNALESIAGATLVSRFLRSPDYEHEARGIAIGVLTQSARLDSFKLFFPIVRDTTTRENYHDVVQLSQSLSERVSQETENRDKLKSASDSDKPSAEYLRAQMTFDQVDKERDVVGDFIAHLVRKLDPPDHKFDLTRAYVWGADLSGFDFGESVLTGAQILSSELKDSDLSRVSQFKDSRWSYTAWWRARKLNPLLLKYLETEYQFEDKDAKYFVGASRQEYLNETARLESASAKP